MGVTGFHIAPPVSIKTFSLLLFDIHQTLISQLINIQIELWEEERVPQDHIRVEEQLKAVVQSAPQLLGLM